MKNPSQLLQFTEACMALATRQVLPYSSKFSKHTFTQPHREYRPCDKAANTRMDAKLYHRRSLVETVISVLKRKYGAAVSSRVWWRQFRELVARCLVYNVERAVRAGVAFLDCVMGQEIVTRTQTVCQLISFSVLNCKTVWMSKRLASLLFMV